MAKETRIKIRTLIFISIFMFCFSFALIPFYNVLCKATGLNGKVDALKTQFARYKIGEQGIGGRFITIEFDVTHNQQLACELKAAHPVLQIKVGELNHTTYTIKNLSDKKMIIQAIPSISPWKAAKYLKKLECFCFLPQTLAPKASLELPLRFWIEPEIPSNYHRLTLSYTVFDITEEPHG